MSKERLQKLLAAAGVASRRHSEEFIQSGRVRVDGRVIAELGARADPVRQRIFVDGHPLPGPARYQYVLLNKPAGYVTTAYDPQKRPTVFDLLPRQPRLFSIGRLDRDSEGLLLLSNDGEFGFRAGHPRFGLDKEYYIWTAWPSALQLARLGDGVRLEDGWITTARVRVVRRHADGAILSLVLHEGRNRQVRRMFATVGLPVHRLRRVRIGPLLLGALPFGAWRDLDADEVAWVRRSLAVARTEEP